MAGKGGNPDNPNAGEMSFIIFLLLAVLVGWLVWTRARFLLVYPLFAVDWPQYWVLDRLHMLDDQGQKSFRFVANRLSGRGNLYEEMFWQNLVAVQEDVARRTRYLMVAVLGLMAGVVAVRMRGLGFRSEYSLTGSSLKKYYRVIGIEVRNDLLKKVLPVMLRWTFTTSLLSDSGERWVNDSPSLIHSQSQYWKVVMVGAHFDPNREDPDQAPQMSPMQWMRANKVTLTRRDNLDDEAATGALERQLGPSWESYEKAPYHVQAICLLASMNFDRDKKVNGLRDRLTEIHVLQPDKAAELTRVELAKYAIPRRIEDINRRAGRHAFLNTATIGVYGAGGPMKEWGGGEAGVISSSMFRWLKKVDRTLWYCLNNVGRRSFHIEAAGAVSHFQAERVLSQPLLDPYVGSALEGLISYLDRESIDDIEAYFSRGKKVL